MVQRDPVKAGTCGKDPHYHIRSTVNPTSRGFRAFDQRAGLVRTLFIGAGQPDAATPVHNADLGSPARQMVRSMSRKNPHPAGIGRCVKLPANVMLISGFSPQSSTSWNIPSSGPFH